MEALFRGLLAATKVREVTDVLEALATDHRVNWRHVGESENNLATINLGSDPAAGVIERVTNAFDAVLDLEWMQRGQPSNLTSPRSAVEQWFGIPEGKLKNVADLRDAKIAALADRVQVIFRDSDRSDRPTIDIRDFGIGIKADEFANTILSLHKSRKLRKLFLAGAFGQGGSTALAYSQYTLIISRPNVVPDQVPSVGAEVGFTIVRFNSGDPLTDKHGVYEYLVDDATGHPSKLLLSADDFVAGTLVRHVCMELGKYKGMITAPTNSPWFLAHNYLFDPVLPLRLVEERSNSIRGERRAVAGNYRLLTRGEHTEYQRSAQLTFRGGMVSLTWWVLSADGGDTARNRLNQYVLASKPIVVTYNGQKQGDFPNTIIKNDLRLPYLERYIIVHVDCDQLDNESRRQLFPTTREALRDLPIGDDLRRLITDTLGGDVELQRLDDERKRRYLQRADNAAIENIRRRLGNRVKAVLLASGGGTGPRVLPPDPPDPPEPKPPIPVQEPPTFFDIISPNPRKVYAGKRFTVRFRTDADPAYFMRPDSFIAIIDPPNFGQYTGTTNVKDGYGVAYFNAAEDLEVETEARITFEVRPRRSATLQAAITVEVAPLPAGAANVEGKIATPNVNPQWVHEGDDFWADNNWNKQSVAKVVTDAASVEIFVSAVNEKLSALVARAQRRSLEAVESVKDFYLEHIAFHAFLESTQQETAPQFADPDDAGEGSKPDQIPELSRACETICGIADATFDILVTGSSTEPAQSDSVQTTSEIVVA